MTTLLCAAQLSNTLGRTVASTHTEVVIPVYARIPDGALATPMGGTAGDTTGAESSLIEWIITGHHDIATGGAGDSLGFQLYYGTTAGSGGTAIKDTGSGILLCPMNAAHTWQFKAQLVPAAFGSTVLMRMHLTMSLVASPSSGPTPPTMAHNLVAYDGNITMSPNGELYLWWGITLNTASANGSTFNYVRSVICRAEGLKL